MLKISKFSLKTKLFYKFINLIQEISSMSKKIYVVLPNKDQFIKNYAGSAFYLGKRFFKKSIFKKTFKFLVLLKIQKMYL